MHMYVRIWLIPQNMNTVCGCFTNSTNPVWYLLHNDMVLDMWKSEAESLNQSNNQSICLFEIFALFGLGLHIQTNLPKPNGAVVLCPPYLKMAYGLRVNDA